MGEASSLSGFEHSEFGTSGALDVSMRNSRKPRRKVGRYAKLGDGQRIIDALKDAAQRGQSVSNIPGINPSTLASYKARYRRSGGAGMAPLKRGPKPNVLITPEIHRNMCNYLDTHSTATVEQVRGFVNQRYQLKVTKSFMQGYLQEHFKVGLRYLWTWPAATTGDVDDVDPTIGNQQECQIPSMESALDISRCIFVGEMSFEHTFKRKFPMGKDTELEPKPPSDTPLPTVAVVIAVSRRGLVESSFKYYEGSTSDSDVLDFLKRLLAVMDRSEDYRKRDIVLSLML